MNGKKTSKEKKETKETIEQERNLLRITLDYLIKENENLKRQIEDIKITSKTNKDLLKEYIDKITNKDKVVEKMNNTIEQLQTRIHSLEDYIRSLQSGSSSNNCSPK